MSEEQGNQQQKNNANASQDQPQFYVQDSLVPDLMKVYESMTQSSTPQDAAVATPHTSVAQTSFPGQQPMPQTHNAQASYEPYQQHQVPVSGQQSQQEGYYNPSAQHQQLCPPFPESFQDQTSLPQVSPYPLPSLPAPPPLVASSRKAAPTNTKNNGRSMRKRSFDKSSETKDKPPKNRKKSNDMDSRWSKRFTWPDDLHRDFVSAIFDVGLKHSSPSAILEHMPAHEQITSERVKSHLQKYRLHRAKSKKEFMSSYDASLKKIRSGGVDRKAPLSDGQVAAHLSFSTVTEADATTDVGPNSQENNDELAFGENPQLKSNNQFGKLALPRLTEEEKNSNLGTSLGHITSLFFLLTQQLAAQRAAKAGTTSTGVERSSNYSSTTAQAQNGINAPPTSQVATYSHPSYDSHQPQFKDNIHQPPTSHDAGHIPQAAHHQEQGVENDDKAHASTRTNFEENKLMKKEMENQMFFQNKMRDLKQRELNKYKQTQDPTSAHDNRNSNVTTASFAPNQISYGKKAEEKTVAGKDTESTMKRSQGSGENAEAGEQGEMNERSRGISIGGTDEFWNTDVVDEQLFEFLMTP